MLSRLIQSLIGDETPWENYLDVFASLPENF
jgi:hypothetical protein